MSEQRYDENNKSELKELEIVDHFITVTDSYQLLHSIIQQLVQQIFFTQATLAHIELDDVIFKINSYIKFFSDSEEDEIDKYIIKLLDIRIKKILELLLISFKLFL